MRLYIAGPMTGIKDFNFPEFHRVTKLMREAGYDGLNPAEKDCGSTNKSWEFYMKLSIKELMGCEGLCTLDGCANSKGANLEIYLANTLNMPVLHYSEWLDGWRVRNER